jgi:hypothetical protein
MPAHTAAVPARSPAYSPRIDGRSAAAKRAKRLTAEYVAALGGSDAVDPVMLAKVRRAAELVVVAECARAKAMQGDAVLDDMVRVDRLADLAVRRLGLDRKPASPVPSLAEYVANRKAAP